MAALSLEEANKRYNQLYVVLQKAGGLMGLLTWEKKYCSLRLDNYTRERILDSNFSHNPSSFNDHLAKLVPPERLLIAQGLS